MNPALSVPLRTCVLVGGSSMKSSVTEGMAGTAGEEQRLVCRLYEASLRIPDAKTGDGVQAGMSLVGLHTWIMLGGPVEIQGRGMPLSTRHPTETSGRNDTPGATAQLSWKAPELGDSEEGESPRWCPRGPAHMRDGSHHGGTSCREPRLPPFHT